MISTSVRCDAQRSEIWVLRKLRYCRFAVVVATCAMILPTDMSLFVCISTTESAECCQWTGIAWMSRCDKTEDGYMNGFHEKLWM